MENASKALIIAAEVLIAVMIMSVGVYLFNRYAAFSEEEYKKIESTQIAQFNNQFLKYTGSKTVKISGSEKVIPVEVTIHDIVSLANLAKMYNEQNDLKSEFNYSDNTAYIRVDISIPGYRNLERKQEKDLNNYIKEHSLISYYVADVEKKKTKYFKCKSYNISETSKKVNYIEFEPFEDVDYINLEAYNKNK